MTLTRPPSPQTLLISSSSSSSHGRYTRSACMCGAGCGDLCRWGAHLNRLVTPVGLGGSRGLGLLGAPGSVRTVLDEDDAVEGLEASPELQVDFALDVHEDEAAQEANSHHSQLGPEGPLQHA